MGQDGMPQRPLTARSVRTQAPCALSDSGVRDEPVSFLRLEAAASSLLDRCAGGAFRPGCRRRFPDGPQVLGRVAGEPFHVALPAGVNGCPKAEDVVSGQVGLFLHGVSSSLRPRCLCTTCPGDQRKACTFDPGNVPRTVPLRGTHRLQGIAAGPPPRHKAQHSAPPAKPGLHRACPS